MSSLAVVTTFPPNRWTAYAKRMIESHVQYWPDDVILHAYYEGTLPDFKHEKVKFINIEEANPELVNFKQRHKDDPVANGEVQEIPGGVRRLPGAGNKDKNKGSFLWAAVRFANKVFCVVNAVRNSKDYDYVVWIDGDTFSFRPIPMDFFEKLLPQDTMLTYLGRENPKLNDGGKYPECGFVGYNMKHPEIQNFVDDWENLYVTDEVFKLLEWHDSYVFWHLSKLYRRGKNIQVNDIGYWKGVKGHHVFVNSELGEYMDHMKGKRKKTGSSARSDLRSEPTVDYWKRVPSALS